MPDIWQYYSRRGEVKAIITEGAYEYETKDAFSEE